MFDTHCHLNFSAFKKNLEEVIKSACANGVEKILIPGTDLASSLKAVEIANANEEIYAAVGIHPHHAHEFKRLPAGRQVQSSAFGDIEKFLENPKVVAVGEVGIDRHPYEKTKYENYSISEEFINSQEKLFRKQIGLALQYGKSLIIHNREAKKETLAIINELWDDKLKEKVVFHCCEPDDELLSFATEKGIFIGIDGDITYNKEKQEFIKKIPLDQLVLETDSPFLLPEPLRSQKKYPNEPKNIVVIAEFVADILNVSVKKLAEITFENSRRLFLENFS